MSRKRNRIFLYIISTFPILLLQFLILMLSSKKYFNAFLVVILIGLGTILLFEIILHFLSIKPLTYEQLDTLSYRYTKKRFDKSHKFSNKTYVSNENALIGIDHTGGWYPCNIPVSKFPSYVKSLITENEYNWVVVGIESNGAICSLWINRGLSSSSPELSCSLGDIVTMCKSNECHTVLRFQTGKAVDINYSSNSNSCASYFSQKGMNWLDFAYSKGEFVCFNQHISPDYHYSGHSVSEYVDVSGLSFLTDVSLRRKYIKMTKIYRICRNVFFIALATLLQVLWFACFVVDIANYTPSETVQEESIIEEATIESIETTTATVALDKLKPIAITGVTADSEYKSMSGKDFSAKQMIDNDYSTCWQDGSQGSGVGERLSFEFAESTVYKIGIVNGNQTYEGSFSKNSRLSEITLQFFLNGNEVLIAQMSFGEEDVDLEDFILEMPVDCDSMVITIDSVYEGTNYSDTGVTEVIIYGE